MNTNQIITLKRIYDTTNPEDDYRVLVDQLWPRGISKENAHINEWNKDLAPSTELRKWFNHDPNKWEEFSQKYSNELNHNNSTKEFLTRLKKQEKITLVFAEKDIEHCHPIILKNYLDKLNQKF